MSAIDQVSSSLRTARMRALAPRALFYALVAILCLVGLRAIIAGPVQQVTAPPQPLAASDPAAESFAEGFTRAYLAWDADAPDRREQLLAAYIPEEMGRGAGLTPAAGSRQRVLATTVAGLRRSGRRVIVAIAADTTSGPINLAVPVERDRRGFLHIAGYPALVGPSPVSRDASLARGDDVGDEALVAVARRALTNYLAGAQQNLRADLTADAVVTLPPQRLTVTAAEDVTWVTPGRRVAAEVRAQDAEGGAWTLRYELDVRKSDRWYVRSIQHDPTSKEVLSR